MSALLSFCILHAVAEAPDCFQTGRIVQLFPEPFHRDRQCIIIYIAPAAIPDLLQQLAPGDRFPLFSISIRRMRYSDWLTEISLCPSKTAVFSLSSTRSSQTIFAPAALSVISAAAPGYGNVKQRDQMALPHNRPPHSGIPRQCPGIAADRQVDNRQALPSFPYPAAQLISLPVRHIPVQEHYRGQMGYQRPSDAGGRLKTATLQFCLPDTALRILQSSHHLPHNIFQS